MIRTSVGSCTPLEATTWSRTRSISRSISAAVTPPLLMISLACFSETQAPPIRARLSPAASKRHRTAVLEELSSQGLGAVLGAIEILSDDQAQIQRQRMLALEQVFATISFS